MQSLRAHAQADAWTDRVTSACTSSLLHLLRKHGCVRVLVQPLIGRQQHMVRPRCCQCPASLRSCWCLSTGCCSCRETSSLFPCISKLSQQWHHMTQSAKEDVPEDLRGTLGCCVSTHPRIIACYRLQLADR